MRNAWVRKISMIGCICIGIGATGFGQYRELRVDTLGQKTGSWCWAACMEMIIKFHNPDTSLTGFQSNLAKKYRLLKTSATTPSTDPDSCCGVSCLNDFHGLTIAFSRESLSDPSSKITADYIDQLFSDLGYSSMQEMNLSAQPMLWEEIKSKLMIAVLL